MVDKKIREQQAWLLVFIFLSTIFLFVLLVVVEW